MNEEELYDLRFPVGEFHWQPEPGAQYFAESIAVISAFPSEISREVLPLSDVQLDTTYRPGGWTLRQVVHHCADSHMQSLTRFKLALTEDKPVIKPYLENRWAEQPDEKNYPIHASLRILEGVHERWTVLLKSLTPQEWKRCFFHPESKREISLEEALGIYAWHCRHHLAHITRTKNNRGW